MIILDGKGNLDDKHCVLKCEYCGHDYRYHRDNHQYSQEFKEISIKKDR